MLRQVEDAEEANKAAAAAAALPLPPDSEDDEDARQQDEQPTNGASNGPKSAVGAKDDAPAASAPALANGGDLSFLARPHGTAFSLSAFGLTAITPAFGGGPDLLLCHAPLLCCHALCQRLGALRHADGDAYMLMGSFTLSADSTQLVRRPASVA